MFCIFEFGALEKLIENLKWAAGPPVSHRVASYRVRRLPPSECAHHTHRRRWSPLSLIGTHRHHVAPRTPPPPYPLRGFVEKENTNCSPLLLCLSSSCTPLPPLRCRCHRASSRVLSSSCALASPSSGAPIPETSRRSTRPFELPRHPLLQPSRASPSLGTSGHDPVPLPPPRALPESYMPLRLTSRHRRPLVRPSAVGSPPPEHASWRAYSR
jgi:hypothetical protein